MKALLSLDEWFPKLEAMAVGISVNVPQVLALVAAEYLRLGFRIKPGNQWRWGKLADSAAGCRDVDKLKDVFAMSDNLSALLYVTTFSADIGRLAIVVDDMLTGTRTSQESHGSVSAELLEKLGVTECFREAWGAVSQALTWHSRIRTPVLEDLRGDEGAWALCCLLRDLDMCMNIRGAGAYVNDKGRMERELIANHLVMAASVDESIIERFEAGGPIDRSKCSTYVEYMLQFIAWRGNFTFREVWDHAVADGGFNPVIEWLKVFVGISPVLDRILNAVEIRYGINVNL